jgi:hypothetical protein
MLAIYALSFEGPAQTTITLSSIRNYINGKWGILHLVLRLYASVKTQMQIPKAKLWYNYEAFFNNGLF